MPEKPGLKEPYVLARCCEPRPDSDIVGYHSFETAIKVHRADCTNLSRTDRERLVQLNWSDILESETECPGESFGELDALDFAILAHHDRVGLDYSLVVARSLQLEKTEAFQRHRKLRELGLIERVDKLMIQYRKGIVDHKWIKHRNHTYYDLTDLGRGYLAWHRSHGAKPAD